METVLTSVYPTADLYAAPSNLYILAGRTILSLQNDFVYEINDILIDQTPSTAHILYSINSFVMDDKDFADTAEITSEFLNSINASGLPLSYLRLKVSNFFYIMRLS